MARLNSPQHHVGFLMLYKARFLFKNVFQAAVFYSLCKTNAVLRTLNKEPANVLLLADYYNHESKYWIFHGKVHRVVFHEIT